MVCVCLHVCACAHTCGYHPCEYQRLTSRVFLSPFPPYFLRQDFSSNLEPHPFGKAGLLESPRLLLSTYTPLRFQVHCPQTWLVMCVPGIQTQVKLLLAEPSPSSGEHFSKSDHQAFIQTFGLVFPCSDSDSGAHARHILDVGTHRSVGSWRRMTY